MTVSTQPPNPQVSDVNDISQKLVHQVMSSKPTGEGADPQVFPRISHVELNSKSGDHLVEGHVKKVTLAIDSCDVDFVHEPSLSKSSVVGGNTITHENQEYDDTPGGGDGQNFAPLFDINECLEGDKYLNTIVNKKLNKALNDNKHMACDTFRLWRAQSEFDFGFIPLSDFILPSDESISEYVSCPIECHRKVKASGNINFLKCRTPVQSQLNIVEWETQLQGYWDVQLIHLLRFGFPLDFNRSSVLKHDNRNHTSALDFPAHVDAYLAEELKYGAILGPYAQNPIPDCHFSPFMTHEKSNSTNRRVIIDLSWPKDYSVNAGVDKNSYVGTDFVLSFPTIDDITEAVKKVGKGAHLYKIDVSRAFRHVRLDPHDYDVRRRNAPVWELSWDANFQRLSDAIRHMMCHQGFTVLNYIDDFIGVATPSVIRRSYDTLFKLLQKLGLEVSIK